MPSTMNPACPLCSLRFGDEPLLDLHIREDHRQRVHSPQDGPGDPGSTRAGAPWADSGSHEHDLASTQSWTSKEATAPTTRSRPRTGRPMSVLRRALRALALRPRPQMPVPPDGEPGKARRRTATERADHEACLICRASVPI